MSESDERTTSMDELRKNPAGGRGGKAAGSPVFFSGLLGYTIGFFIAAAAVVVIRGIDSETDGMNALMQALMILGPAMLLLIVAFVIRKKSGSSGPVVKSTAMLCAVLGLAAGGAIWVTAPTQQGLAKEMLEGNRELIQSRAEQLAACRAQIDPIPVGKLEELITAEHMAELDTLKMVVGWKKYGRPGGYNTMLTVDTDFARLKPGTNPDDIMMGYERPKPPIRAAGSYGYGRDFNEVVDELAELAYGDPYLRPDKVEEVVEAVEPLRYLVILRAGEVNPPMIIGKNFLWGYFGAEAFCFDLEEKRLVAAFPFAATNSETVEYKYAKNASVTAEADSAMSSIQEDLEKNVWPAFWQRLHEVAGAAVSSNEDIEVPFKKVTLDEAKLVVIQKKLAEAERERRVKEELERAGSGAPDAGGTDKVGPDALELTAEQDAEVRELLSEVGKIAAVKRVREISGGSLLQAKNYVDALEAQE